MPFESQALADIHPRRVDDRFTPEADICSAIAHVRIGPIADIELSAFAPRRYLAANAEFFRFSAEGCGRKPFGREAAL